MFGQAAATPPPPALPDPLPAAPSYASGQAARPAGGSAKVPGFGSTLMTSASDNWGSAPNTNVQRKSLLGQ